MERMVEQILIVMRRTGDLKEWNAVPGQRQKLHKDEELRNNYWNRYVQQGLLERHRPDMGAIFLGKGFRDSTTQRLIYLPDGFRRYQNDRVEIFNRAGQLVRIQYPLQGFSLDLERDSQGRLQRLLYPNGALHFSLNSDGTVSDIVRNDSIDNHNRLRSLYFYQDGNLTMSNDADMNNYKYQYDQNSNMLAIGYVDNSTMRMTYNGDQHIRSITTRDKATTWYSYGDLYEENDRQGYFTEVQRPDGSRERYEEHTRRNAYGSWLKAKIRTTVAGVTTEAEYSPEGQLYQLRGGPWPVRIERDSLGRAILIAEDGIVTHIAYNADSRVTMLAQQPVDAPLPTERRDFSYNADGRLIQIAPSNSELLTLNYVSDCLTSLTLGNQKLEILCNDQKLPKTLRLSQYPTLPVDVVFDQWGDIKSATAEPDPASTIAGLLRDVLRLTKSPIDLKKKIVGIECLECALPDLKELLVFPERTPLEAIIKQLEKPAP
jgi:YD repeat-containing protein